MEYTSLKAQIEAEFAARGWDPSDLGAFRMEGEDEGGAPAVPAAPEPPAAPAAPESDPFDDTGVQTFDRAYVEKLRSENAKRRTESKRYDDAFDGYDDDDLEVLLSTVKTLREDPKAGLTQWDAIAKSLHEQFPDEDTPTGAELKKEAEAGAPDDKPLTRRELEAFYAEKEEEAGVAEKTKEVLAEAEALGYKPGSPEHQRLIWMTANQPEFGYDLAKADAALKAETQAIIDKFVAERAADAEGGAATFGGLPAVKAPEKPTWRSARAAAEARVSGIQLS